MNCEKNAVVCEGYPEKQIWKSGKERAEGEWRKDAEFLTISMGSRRTWISQTLHFVWL